MNSKKQGTLGVSKAVSFFVEEGNTVAIPLGDDQRYDLIVDREGKLYRVEVKTTQFINSHGKYQVGLKSSSGSKRQNEDKWRITNLSRNDCDLVFIWVGDGSRYLIPIEVLDGKGNLVLTQKMDQYKI